MGLGDFWLQSNNGKKISLQNLKELKKSDLEGNNVLIRIFNIFDTQNADGTKGSDGVLNKEELTSLFNTMLNSAKSKTGKEASIFETEEAEEFISTTQTSEGKTLKELGVKATDIFEFLSKLIKPENQSLTVDNMPTNINLTEEQAQEEVISILSNDAAEARALLMKQDNGVVSDLYNKYKEWRDDDLSLSNIEEAVVLQQEGADNLYKAKEGKLSKLKYFLQNREHLKTMMKRRLFRKDENTGLDFLDRNRGKITKEQFAKFMEEYINEQIDKIDKLDSLKNIQHRLFVTTDAGVEQMLKNYKQKAEDELLHNPVAEQRLVKIKTPKIPKEFDTTEPMTFEEVFKFERNQEYSKEKVENYLRQKQKTDFATGAYNKYQSFKMAGEEFLADYDKETASRYGTSGAMYAPSQPNPENQSKKVVNLFTAYYDNLFKPDLAKEELERLIAENNLSISVITKEDGSISLDLSKISNDSQKNRVLNQLVKLESGKLKEQLEKTLGGDIEEKLTSISSQTQSAYTNAYGQDFSQELAQAMADDNKTFIQKYTGSTSMTGMGLTVIGGILCFTPAAPLGAGMVTAGNTLAIGGMVAESGLGFADALLKFSPDGAIKLKEHFDEEEIKELSKTLIMNASGFVIGMQAGKTGMKAFNKLIDKKLAEVFKTEMVKSNRAEALKQVFTNPEYLKNFMQAAGVKLSADFIISYAGDLAMMGVLDTQDDWQSLLQANLIGILAGMGGDIKEVAHLGMKGDRYRALRQKEGENGLTSEEANELAALRNDPDIKKEYPDYDEVLGLKEYGSTDRTITPYEKKAIVEQKIKKIEQILQKTSSLEELLKALNENLSFEEVDEDINKAFGFIEKKNDALNISYQLQKRMLQIDFGDEKKFLVEADWTGNIYGYRIMQGDTGNITHYVYNATGNLKKVSSKDYKNITDDIFNKRKHNRKSDFEEILKDSQYIDVDLIVKHNGGDNPRFGYGSVEALNELIKTENDAKIFNRLLTEKNSYGYIYDAYEIISILKSEKMKSFVLDKINKNEPFYKYSVLMEIDKDAFESKKESYITDNQKSLQEIPDIRLDEKIQSDLEQLNKWFLSNTQAQKQIPAGEVGNINGKLYCNDGDRLIPLSISKTKFEELFPQQQRYNISQGDIGDCWLIDVFGGLIETPKGRAGLYKLFSEEGNDIVVKFPDSDKSIKFRNGEINELSSHSAWLESFSIRTGTSKNKVAACKGFEILEQACAVHRNNSYSKLGQDGYIQNIFFMNKLMHELVGGRTKDAVKFILGKEGYRLYNVNYFDSNLLEINLSQPNTMIMFSVEKDLPEYGLYKEHAMRIVDYNKDNNTIKFSNPWENNKLLEIPLEILKDTFPELKIMDIL